MRSRSPQRRYYLRRQPGNSGPAAGRRGPEGRQQAARGDRAPGPSNTPAQQAAGEDPDGPTTTPYLLIGLVLLVRPVPLGLPERRDQ